MNLIYLKKQKKKAGELQIVFKRSKSRLGKYNKRETTTNHGTSNLNNKLNKTLSSIGNL